ncbi:MAG: hypothetical protein WBA55_02820, partial [Allopontixanthobacter sediminis]
METGVKSNCVIAPGSIFLIRRAATPIGRRHGEHQDHEMSKMGDTGLNSTALADYKQELTPVSKANRNAIRKSSPIMFSKTFHATHPDMMNSVTNDDLRARYQVQGMFADGEINLNYSHNERFVIGGVVPNGGAIN